MSSLKLLSSDFDFFLGRKLRDVLFDSLSSSYEIYTCAHTQYCTQCTISINSSATVTRDAPDENMVLSGSRDERDNYKISSGSRFFFLKLVGG